LLFSWESKFYAENFISVEYIFSVSDVLLNCGFAEKADRLGEIRYSEVKAVEVEVLQGSPADSMAVFMIG
jgi:hypothetical protein